MATNARANQDCIDSDIDERTERALEQYLTVLPDQGEARDAPGQAMVVSESGSEYLVDVRLGTCECPDHEYRDVTCKHIVRARYATGVEPIPARVASAVDVDPSLGEHTDADLQFATADGGVVSAGDDDRLSGPDDGQDDVDDCACDDLPEGVPCADCYISEGVEWEGR
jgi:hypothetical protein